MADIDNNEEESPNQIDKLKKRNMEENRKNNIALKQQLREISSQIEEIFAQQENKKHNKLQNSMENSNKIDIEEYTNFKSKIFNYKKKIESKQKEINNTYEFENIIKNENEHKSLKNKLLQLKKENKILTKLTKQLNDQLEEMEGGVFINGKKVQMAEKLKYLKDEIKILNENSKTLNNKLKAQNIEINELNQIIEKMKKNIDYAKHEKEQENKNDEMSNEELIKKIKELKESVKQLELIKDGQEENYNLSIKKQNKAKSIVEQDIKIL